MLTWVDTETTGLLADQHALLEVAVLVTDNELNEVAAESWVLPFDINTDPRQPDDYVRKMHTENGLWTACDQEALTGATVLEAERKVLAFLRRFTEPRTTPICGSTIAFDRGFLHKHMPSVEAHFSHRNLDVSVLRELAERWYPEAYASRPRDGGHRALPDIRGSVASLRHYRATVLR